VIGAALDLRGIVKRFGATTALEGADFVLRPATVHALLGENGAGKTTLMRIIYGLLSSDAGIMHVGDRVVRFRGPREAILAGIGMVHQHFTSVPRMTVAENVALGGSGRYDERASIERVRRLGRETGLHLDPIARAEDLTPNGWNAVIGIVLNGTFYCTSAVGKRMIAAKKGAILNVIANYAWTGAPGVVHSASAKAGVLAMTQTLAVEWARHKIRVNAIAPGPVHTEGASKRLFPNEMIEEGIRKFVDWYEEIHGRQSRTSGRAG
jgi:NAD(P)-dependent dehydrogenase (short-subunit alcohol dehydrogenase family)